MAASGTQAFLNITLNSHVKTDLDEFKSSIRGIDGVSEAYHVTGPVDYVLHVKTADNAALETVINRLTELPTLARVETTIVYSQV